MVRASISMDGVKDILEENLLEVAKSVSLGAGHCLTAGQFA